MTAQLQVALDRLALDDAVRIARQVSPHADWVEVGTSLIKEFGMESVRRVVAAAEGTPVLADTKTNDNARYEFELAYDAGAAAATVMATAPDQTIDTCFAVAADRRSTVMVDLLGADEARQQVVLSRYPRGVVAVHVGKDVQESGSGSGPWSLPKGTSGRRVALAGGVRLSDVPRLLELTALTDCPIIIVGSAVTQALDPARAASEFTAAFQEGQHQ